MFVAKLLNFVIAQAGWLACVLGGARAWPYVGAALGLALAGVNLACAPRPASEIKLAATSLVLGVAFDTLLMQLGLLVFSTGMPLPGVSPVWMWVLWPLFATTLNGALAWLKDNRVLSALLGAIGGPMAYYAGAELGAVVLAGPEQALVALSLGWALMMPLLMTLARWFDGPRSVVEPGRRTV